MNGSRAVGGTINRLGKDCPGWLATLPGGAVAAELRTPDHGSV